MKYIWSKIALAWFIGMLIFVGLFVPVDAAELKSWSRQQTRLTYDNAGSSSFSDWETAPYTFSNMSLPVKRVQFRVRSSDGLSVDNTYNFTFGYLPNPDAVGWGHVAMLKNGESNYSESNFTCGQPYVNNNGYYLIDCSINPQYSYSSTDDLWITIYLSGNGGYLTSIRPYMFGYDERLGTNAVITEQTNMINNSINNLSNDINNSATNIINGINNANMVCKEYDKSNVGLIKDRYIDLNGIVQNVGGTWGVTDFLDVFNAKVSVVNTRVGFSTSTALCFYNVNKSKVGSCIRTSDLVLGELTLPNDTHYIRFTIDITNNKPVLNICKNGNSAIVDTLEDDDVDEPDEMFEDFEDLQAENGVITNLLSLPVTLYAKVLSNINGTCTPKSLGSLYNTELVMPCIDIDDYLGSTLWNTLDIIISGAFVIVIGRKMIHAFNNFTSLKEGDVLSND